MITIKLATQLLRSGVHTAGLYADGHMQPLIWIYANVHNAHDVI